MYSFVFPFYLINKYHKSISLNCLANDIEQGLLARDEISQVISNSSLYHRHPLPYMCIRICVCFLCDNMSKYSRNNKQRLAEETSFGSFSFTMKLSLSTQIKGRVYLYISISIQEIICLYIPRYCAHWMQTSCYWNCCQLLMPSDWLVSIGAMYHSSHQSRWWY